MPGARTPKQPAGAFDRPAPEKAFLAVPLRGEMLPNRNRIAVRTSVGWRHSNRPSGTLWAARAAYFASKEDRRQNVGNSWSIAPGPRPI